MEEKSERYLFEEMPVGRAVATLSIPTIISQVVTMIYNLADTFFIGQIGDPLMVAAVSLVSPWFNLLTALGNLFGLGGSSLISRMMGAQNRRDIKYVSAFSIWGGAVVTLAFSLATYFVRTPLLNFLGASPDTYGYAEDYLLWVVVLGGVPTMVSLALGHLLRSEGHARQASAGMMFGGILNVVLDPVFIFAFHLGVRGAALATILSQAVSCIWVLSFLCGKKTILHIRKKNLILKPEIILPCVALGLATFIMQASESIISVCFNSSLLKYGGDIAVGAMTILTSVMQFAMLPLQGLGQGAQPVLSYNYGAKNRDRVKKAFRLLLTASLCYSTILWAFIMLFPQVFAEMFTSDSALLGFTKSALRIYCACLLLFGIQIACQMAFTSFGKAKASIAVAVTRKFILLLPLIYLLPHILTGNKTNAVYMAEPIADFLAVSFTTVLFTFQFRKVLKELEG